MLTRSFSSALALFSSFVALALTSLTSLHAQTDSTLPNGPALGATVDRFIYEGQGITAVSFRFSGLRSRTVGSEIGISLFHVSGPGVTVLLKAGVSTLTGFGGGFVFTPGYHLGSGLIVQTGARWGVRVDLARHVYVSGVESTEPIWSVGVGFTGLARRVAHADQIPPAPQF
jgi:hypothetical protein